MELEEELATEAVIRCSIWPKEEVGCRSAVPNLDLEFEIRNERPCRRLPPPEATTCFGNLPFDARRHNPVVPKSPRRKCLPRSRSRYNIARVATEELSRAEQN